MESSTVFTITYNLLTLLSPAKNIYSMTLRAEMCPQCSAGVAIPIPPSCEYCGVGLAPNEQTGVDDVAAEHAYIENAMRDFLGDESYTDAVYVDPDGQVTVIAAYNNGENVTVKFEKAHPKETKDRLIAESRLIPTYVPS